MSYLLPAFVAVVLIYSAAKKVNVYDSFVEGGKKALKLAYVVFPFVSSVLIMIALFRESGLSEMLTAALEKPLSAVGIPPSMAELLLLRPFSGSGTLAYFETLLKKYGGNSFEAKCRRNHGQFGNDILRRRRLFFGHGCQKTEGRHSHKPILQSFGCRLRLSPLSARIVSA